VPSNLINVSNGQLNWKKESGNFSTYQWKVSYPILNYNISVNAGNYIHWKESYQGQSVLTLNYYSLKENEGEAREAFKIVGPMMKVYENYFGPYPFPRDEFKLIQAPYPMEHQSCVSVGKDFEEDLILHEAAHEWWGNSISCTDLADIWIHEAFATYAVYLFKESSYGKEQASKYLDYLAKNINGSSPLVGIYGVNHIHYDFGDAYSKGALLIHTLRNLINNDSAWFDLIRNLQRAFKYQSITTPELVKYINDKSGQDFTYLFGQYLYQVEIPRLEIKIKEGENKLSIDYRWQNAKENFAMPVQITIAENKFDFIYPTTSWKNMELENLSVNKFKVEPNKLITSSVVKK
jgi:aminopeptidase N